MQEFYPALGAGAFSTASKHKIKDTLKHIIKQDIKKIDESLYIRRIKH